MQIRRLFSKPPEEYLRANHFFLRQHAGASSRPAHKCLSWLSFHHTEKKGNDMIHITTILLISSLSLFILNGCVATVPDTYHKTEVEEVIRIKDLPPKVLAALPKEYDKKEFTYKRKLKDGVMSYDVDYEKGGNKFSIAYDDQGRVMEEEKKVEFSDIPHDLRIKVEKVLSAYYPNYKILMVEEVYISDEMLLEVFFSHPKAKTGFAEAVFEYQTGTFREFINIKMKSIETLN